MPGLSHRNMTWYLPGTAVTTSAAFIHPSEPFPSSSFGRGRFTFAYDYKVDVSRSLTTWEGDGAHDVLISNDCARMDGKDMLTERPH